ncbi:MAG: phage protease [Puniceicoccales bacterium]|jgi:hypothetical protein|nr:phage protease [Puniceicoccales bacterium]
MNIEWLKLANFGEYHHAKGVQVLDAASAKDIYNSFHSIRWRLVRGFHGIPIFIGHPDDPEFLSKNEKIYGRIENLKVEDDALWISIKWAKSGKGLFKNGILKYLSPRWLTVQTRDGKLLPRRLLSVGMTNHPNIPCEHVAKIETIGEPAEEGKISEPECQGEAKPEVSAHSNVSGGDGVAIFQVENAAKQVEKLALAVPKSEEISERIFPSLQKKIILHTVSRTDALVARDACAASRERILRLVFERMQKFSENYGDAWMAVKRTNPELFQKHF